MFTALTVYASFGLARVVYIQTSVRQFCLPLLLSQGCADTTSAATIPLLLLLLLLLFSFYYDYYYYYYYYYYHYYHY